jgi:hypothetical protein
VLEVAAVALAHVPGSPGSIAIVALGLLDAARGRRVRRRPGPG